MKILSKTALMCAASAVLFAVMLQARSFVWSAQARLAQSTTMDFIAAMAEFRSRKGRLPGDANADGEIDAAESEHVAAELAQAGLMKSASDAVSLQIGGARVTMRAIARRASAVRGFPPGVENVIELRGLPCSIAEELDARGDDGNFASGATRASVPVCAVGGKNDPVPVVAVAMR